VDPQIVLADAAKYFLRNISTFPFNVLFVGSLTLIYLGFRWMAYERRDSILVDLGIFTLVHTIIQILDHVIPRMEKDPQMSIPGIYWGKFVGIVFILFVAIWIQSKLRRKLDAVIDRFFAEVRAQAAGGWRVLDRLEELAKEIIEVDLSYNLLERAGFTGKLKKREMIVDLVNQLGGANVQAERQLLLPAVVRIWWAFVLLLLCSITLVMAAFRA
jgi:hypothetical protein